MTRNVTVFSENLKGFRNFPQILSFEIDIKATNKSFTRGYVNGYFRVSDDWYISLFSNVKTSFCFNRICTCADYICTYRRFWFGNRENDVGWNCKVTPTGIMIGFSILYFGLMIDRGLFDPMISRLIRFAKGDPLKIVMATAFITLIVALDGDGSATFMITVTALLPIYKRLGMSSLTLAGVVALGAGVMNIIPWEGR